MNTEQVLLHRQEFTERLEQDGQKDGESDTNGIPIQLRFGDPFVHVYVNGKGAYQFYLDIGSSVCVISPKLAEKLGLERGEMRWGVRQEGREYYTTHVETIAVGAVQCMNPRTIISDCSQVSKRVNARVDGFLGHSFLQEFRVTINYPERILSVLPPNYIGD